MIEIIGILCPGFFKINPVLTNPGKKQNPSLLKKLLQFILFLFVAVLLIALAFRGISFRNIIEQVFKAKLFWVVLSFFISAFAHIIRAIRWNLLIEPLGYAPPLQKTFYAVMTGYLANLAFPRLGEVTRCGSLTKSEGIPFNKLLGTVITERIIDVLSLLICLTIVMVIEFDRLGNFLKDNIAKPVVHKFSLIGSPLLIFITVVILTVFAFLIFRYLRKRDNRFSRVIRGVAEGIMSVRSLKRPWLFIFHSVLIWFLYFLSVYVAFFAMSPTKDLGLGAALFLLVAGGVAMSAPVQGGIGAYHLLVSQGLILYGLTHEQGLAFATLVHSLQVILSVLLGGISFLLLFSGTSSKKLRSWDSMAGRS